MVLFCVGLVVGAMVGVLVMCLLTAARDSDGEWLFRGDGDTDET